MHAGDLFYVFFLLHTKLIFPCMLGDLNKSYMRVKIHISDQTSLRICNSVERTGRKKKGNMDGREVVGWEEGEIREGVTAQE
jgi:hypothetical protein